MSILFDIQATQSPAYADRGIARHAIELGLALQEVRPGLVTHFVLNPDWPVPGSTERLRTTGRLTFSDRIATQEAPIYHVVSPFEYVPIDRVWPPQLRSGRLVVTIHDLIPEVFPDHYQRDPSMRRWYKTRLALARRADRLVVTSEATATDVVERLGVPPSRVIAAGGGVSQHFRPAASPELSLATARRAVPLLKARYVLYTGGLEYRKNIDRLLLAYAGLPPQLRNRHQLIIVCAVSGEERSDLEGRVRSLGIAGQAVFTGYVPDETLVALYQAAELFIFPSMYEGFGLPIAEAAACGIPVLAGQNSSLTELIPDREGLFDPLRVPSIRSALEKCLSDRATLDRLAAAAQRQPRRTWVDVAEKVAAVYDELQETRPRRRPRRRPRIAVFSPLPPQSSGIADYSYRLLESLSSRAAIDVFVDANPAKVVAPADTTARRVASFDTSARAVGGYEHVVYCLGNSEFHADALAALRSHPGTVVAHDVRFTGLYSSMAAEREDLHPPPFYEVLRSMYGNRIPADLGRNGWIDFEDFDRYGVLMAREIVALSRRFLVHSNYAAQLARLDADAADAWKIHAVPFGHRPPTAVVQPEHAPNSAPIISTFGIVDRIKQIDKIIEAFPVVLEKFPGATLAIVGRPLAPRDAESHREIARTLNISPHVRLTGHVAEPDFLAWLRKSTVAVQLRAASSGETSASVADCLAAGLPVVVTSLGAARELPDDVAVQVDRDVPATELGKIICNLVADKTRRVAMSRAASGYARSMSFEAAAKALYAHLCEEDRVVPGVASAA